jgi:hypothetical protein
LLGDIALVAGKKGRADNLEGRADGNLQMKVKCLVAALSGTLGDVQTDGVDSTIHL